MAIDNGLYAAATTAASGALMALIGMLRRRRQDGLESARAAVGVVQAQAELTAYLNEQLAASYRANAQQGHDCQGEITKLRFQMDARTQERRMEHAKLNRQLAGMRERLDRCEERRQWTGEERRRR